MKKGISLEGVINTQTAPKNTGLTQRGTRHERRPNAKKLTVELDGETYKRLRIYAAETGLTHQEILEGAVKGVLDGK